MQWIITVWLLNILGENYLKIHLYLDYSISDLIIMCGTFEFSFEPAVICHPY